MGTDNQDQDHRIRIRIRITIRIRIRITIRITIKITIRITIRISGSGSGLRTTNQKSGVRSQESQEGKLMHTYTICMMHDACELISGIFSSSDSQSVTAYYAYKSLVRSNLSLRATCTGASIMN